MHYLVYGIMLDQDLLILLSNYWGWSLPIAICLSLVIYFIPSNIFSLRTCLNLITICLSLVIYFIPSNIFYLRNCLNLMVKSSSQFSIRFLFDKGLSGIMHYRKVFSNYFTTYDTFQGW